DKLVPEKFGRQPICQYVHSMDEVMDAVERKRCQLAVLVPEATMAEVEAIAGGLEKMPPKSTYFYPKLLTGMVFNSLKPHYLVARPFAGSSGVAHLRGGCDGTQESSYRRDEVAPKSGRKYSQPTRGDAGAESGTGQVAGSRRETSSGGVRGKGRARPAAGDG